jgi:hypothetical protein
MSEYPHPAKPGCINLNSDVFDGIKCLRLLCTERFYGLTTLKTLGIQVSLWS